MLSIPFHFALFRSAHHTTPLTLYAMAFLNVTKPWKLLDSRKKERWINVLVLLQALTNAYSRYKMFRIV